MSKPKVFVLMAIYNPNMVWLKEQLTSINSQTYENIELLVCDDCSPSLDESQLDTIIKQNITKIPVKLIRNKTNQGTNKTFERLTLEAAQNYCSQGGELSCSYFAYCDQDDIWESHKIETIMDAIASKNATLAYSDMSIIDSAGNLVADSITKVRKRFNYFEGYELWRKILVRNFISGCCMIIRGDIAKAAMPFELDMQHDRWLSIIASINGCIAYVDAQLVRYRQHGKNQTGVLKDVKDKQSYIDIRLKSHKRILESISSRTDINDDMQKFLSEYIKQMEVRLEYAENKGHNLRKMISYIKYNRAT
ncbi:MAG: glycosyltransferase, partial [Acetivibrionales bacterium]